MLCRVYLVGLPGPLAYDDGVKVGGGIPQVFVLWFEVAELGHELTVHSTIIEVNQVAAAGHHGGPVNLRPCHDRFNVEIRDVYFVHWDPPSVVRLKEMGS